MKKVGRKPKPKPAKVEESDHELVEEGDEKENFIEVNQEDLDDIEVEGMNLPRKKLKKSLSWLSHQEYYYLESNSFRIEAKRADSKKKYFKY